MNKGLQEYKRKSFMEIGEMFFWTATINQWQRQLQPGENIFPFLLPWFVSHEPRRRLLVKAIEQSMAQHQLQRKI